VSQVKGVVIPLCDVVGLFCFIARPFRREGRSTRTESLLFHVATVAQAGQQPAFERLIEDPPESCSRLKFLRLRVQSCFLPFGAKPKRGTGYITRPIFTTRATAHNHEIIPLIN